MYLQYECKSRYRSTRRYSGGTSRRSAPSAVRRHRIGASNQFEAGGFIRSRAEFAWPNIQYRFAGGD